MELFEALVTSGHVGSRGPGRRGGESPARLATRARLVGLGRGGGGGEGRHHRLLLRLQGGRGVRQVAACSVDLTVVCVCGIVHSAQHSGHSADIRGCFAHRVPPQGEALPGLQAADAGRGAELV